MPPISLKIKGDDSFLPIPSLNDDELTHTWRVCTKVKDSLENGSRLENLSWRLWFIQNVYKSHDARNKKSMMDMPLSPHHEQTTDSLPEEKASVHDGVHNIKPILTENYVLNQFTSDQDVSQIVELEDLFSPYLDHLMFADSTTNDINLNYQQQINSSLINSSSIPIMDNSSTAWDQSMASLNSQSINTYSTDTSMINNTNSDTANNDSHLNSYPYYNTENENNSDNSNVNHQGHHQYNQSIYPETGIKTTFSDMNTNISLNESYNPLNDPSTDLFTNNNNNMSYVTVGTSAPIINMPNATLHNKLLATLPRQTLVSAERLLSPAGPKPIPPIHHQHRMTKDSELGFIHNSHPSNENRQQTDYDLSHMDTEDMDKPRHYYNTFQANDKLTKKNPHQATPSTTVSENDKVAKCSNCDTTVTPLWRRSVDDQLLCNACGLYLKLHNAPRPKNLKVGKHKDNPSEYGLNGESLAENDKDIPHTPPTKCSNCGTAKTPLWRRDIEGAPLCNACGLYLKLHNEKRPLSMKTDVIKKRQRTESLLASSQQNGPEYKKPRYYDNKDLYADSYQTSKPAFGYRNVASSLPGTGVLMMGVNSSSTS